jgi:hypothetical protein
MYSDSTYTVIILLVFFYFHLRLRILKIETIMKYNYHDIRCNPFHMFLGSIFNSESGSDVFNMCVKENTESRILSEHQNNIDKYANKVMGGIGRVMSDAEKNQTIVEEKQLELQDLITDSNKKIIQSIQAQNKINKAIIESSEPLSELTTKVEEMSRKFKDTVSSFVKSNIVTSLTD